MITTTKVNMSARIRDMQALHPEYSASEIADRLGVKATYVHNVLWNARKKRAEKALTPPDWTEIQRAAAAAVQAVQSPLAVQVGGDHYKSLKIQPVEYIHANNIGYFEGNVIKYVTRWRNKNGIADLEKAKHYIDLLIEQEKGPQ